MAKVSPVTMPSEEARDAISGWDEGDMVYVLGVGLTVYDGQAFAAGGGGVIVTGSQGDPGTSVSTLVAAGATVEGDTATLEVARLVDPGALWEAEHEYAEGDRILVFGSVVMESKDDGLSGTDEPSWDTVANIYDGDIAWRALGEVGDIPVTILPFGAPDFAYISPTVLHDDAQTKVDTHDAAGAAHDTVIAAAVGAHSSLPNGIFGAHGIYGGASVPSDGGGFAAPLGSLYLFGTGIAGAVYVKFGLADTDWAQLATV